MGDVEDSSTEVVRLLVLSLSLITSGSRMYCNVIAKNHFCGCQRPVKQNICLSVDAVISHVWTWQGVKRRAPQTQAANGYIRTPCYAAAIHCTCSACMSSFYSILSMTKQNREPSDAQECRKIAT